MATHASISNCLLLCFSLEPFGLSRFLHRRVCMLTLVEWLCVRVFVLVCVVVQRLLGGDRRFHLSSSAGLHHCAECRGCWGGLTSELRHVLPHTDLPTNADVFAHVMDTETRPASEATLALLLPATEDGCCMQIGINYAPQTHFDMLMGSSTTRLPPKRADVAPHNT